MKLYLVQQGDAKTKEESPDRPLTDKECELRKESFAK